MFSNDTSTSLAYILPALCIIGVTRGGNWSIATLIFAFGIIPFLELFLPFLSSKIQIEEEHALASNRFYDLLLYINFPILYLIIFLFLDGVSEGRYSLLEFSMNLLGVGIIVGSLGINVAHELGHRSHWFDQILSQGMLMSALYMHFHVEHNQGHHLKVATPDDPATARKGELLYLFWIRSFFGGIFSAWDIERTRLKREGQSGKIWRNKIFRYFIIQGVWLIFVLCFFGMKGLLAAIGFAVIGFLLLESLNYVQHYGLLRKKSESGRYESVGFHHSWSSEHILGRIFLMS